MRLLKLLIVAVSCVVTGASWSRLPSKHENVAEAFAAQTVQLENSARYFSENSASPPDNSYSGAESDAWLLLLSGVGMVIIQLRRRQKILQASRFEIEAELRA